MHSTKYLSVGEDFRTALHNATNYMKELGVLNKSASTPLLPPSTGSSSTNNPQPAAVVEKDHLRIEAMSKLIDILRRNLRVRYELDLSEVLKT